MMSPNDLKKIKEKFDKQKLFLEEDVKSETFNSVTKELFVEDIKHIDNIIENIENLSFYLCNKPAYQNS